MDYDDIRTRLNRTYKSLDIRYDEAVEKHIRIEKWADGRGESWHFGDEEEKPETVNKVMTILYNLASLKDHLKNGFKKSNLDSKVIDKEIDESLHLQVLIDIVNQDKHGSPLRNPRSTKSPKLMGLGNGMRMADPRTGEEKFTMVISGTIIDKNGERIFGLDELVETCFAKWEKLFKMATKETSK